MKLIGIGYKERKNKKAIGVFNLSSFEKVLRENLKNNINEYAPYRTITGVKIKK